MKSSSKSRPYPRASAPSVSSAAYSGLLLIALSAQAGQAAVTRLEITEGCDSWVR